MKSRLVDKAVLKTLVPPSALNDENFEALAGRAYLEEVPPGHVLFNAGDVDRRTVYLLEGELILSSRQGKTLVLHGDSALAKHPVANQQPRQQTAVARTGCKLTRFDSDLLDLMLTWDQLSGIEVAEITGSAGDNEHEGDWMTRILRSEAFLRIPPANIQAMFMRLQEVPVSAGQLIIRQGEEGDYYYILKSGRARVFRTAKTGVELTLAQLVEGDTFGEEALLAEARRNANVVMLSDGVLMRLSKEDFNALLKEPLLKWVTLEEAMARVRQGACWLDVRLESEHQQRAFPGSLNIPLYVLRLRAEGLDPRREYIVHCDTGRRSSAAAFLLGERGFNVRVLKAGEFGRIGKSA